MPILDFKPNFAGQVGINPRLCRLICTDDYDTVTSDNYLAGVAAMGNPVMPTDFIFCSYGDNEFEIFNPVITPGSIILEPFLGKNNVKFPGVNLLAGGDFSKNAFTAASAITGVSNNAHIADNFTFSFSGAGVVDSSKAADAPTLAQAGVYTANSLRLTVTTADAAIGAGDHYEVNTFLEGFDFAPIAGQTCHIPVWVRSAKTGIHCVSLRNTGNNRSYVGTYTIATANTWQQVKVDVTEAPPSAGTWDYTNGKGLVISFVLAAGSTYQTTADAWQTGNFLATSDQVNCLDTVGNIFAIALVGCKAGLIATPWSDDSIAAIRARAERLVEKSYSNGVTLGTNSALGSFQISNSAAVAGADDINVRFRSEKRAIPSVTVYSIAGNAGFVTQNDGSEVAATVTNIGMNGFRVTATNDALKFGCAGHYIANAQFT